MKSERACLFSNKKIVNSFVYIFHVTMSPTLEHSNDVDDDYSVSFFLIQNTKWTLSFSLLNITHDMSLVSMRIRLHSGENIFT